MIKNLVLNTVLPDRSAEPCTVYIHIPKTGGQTLRKFISNQYRPNQRYDINLDRTYKEIAALREIPKEDRAYIRFTTGHMPIGIHKLLPTPTRYISMVREPLSRLLSAYNYAYSFPTEIDLHQKVVDARMDFHTFIEEDPYGIELDNTYVRYFATAKALPLGGCTGETLAQARSNIETHVDFVGLTHRFEESAFLMYARYGWTLPFYSRVNNSVRKLTIDDVEPQTKALVREKNALDYELYAWLESRYDEVAAQYEEELAIGFPKFQTRNRQLGALYQRLRPPR